MKKGMMRICSAFLCAVFLLPMLLVGAAADAEVDAGAAEVPPVEPTPPSADAQLLFATVTLSDGTSYTAAELPSDAEGTEVDACYVTVKTANAPEARLCTPLGLRYVTALSRADFDALTADARVASVRVGTLIVPEETAIRAGGITHDCLAGETYLDVAASPDAWYSEDGETVYFAGSIVDIKEENRNLALVGVGYLTVELSAGECYTVYGACLDGLIASSIATEAKITLRDPALNASERHYMNLFADNFDGDTEMLYHRDFEGLNVLAIGDSLFAGAYETVGDKVWVNLLGTKYGWNLTNLGINGATVSYDPNRTATNKSMYGLLLNDADYCFGSPSYYTAGTPSGNPVDVDLILLEGGSNDYGPKVGALKGGSRSQDPATFLGAWHMMTEELLERYPNATIVFITAWENVDQARPDGANAIEYTSSVNHLHKIVYKKNDRVQIIDAGSPLVSGVSLVNADGTANAEFKAQYAHDQFHLNDAGMELVAGKLLPLIADIVAKRCRTPLTETERMQRDIASLDVLAIGDSLFSGSHQTLGDDVWMNSIGKDCFWNITNLGIGGSTISYDPDRTATNKSIYQMLFNDAEYKFGSTSNSNFYNGGNTAKPKEAVDVILLEAGSNDCGPKVGAPMGTVGSDDPATFLGAWRLVTEELLAQYPNAIVIFITAWEQNDPARTEYTTSVRTLYEELYADNDRVYLIDGGNPEVSGVNMRSAAFREQYAYDAFHLNDEGMALMARNMLPLLWDVIKNQAKIR